VLHAISTSCGVRILTVCMWALVGCAYYTQMVHPYPVLFEKEGELVAHVKYTVLLMPNGNVKITGVGSPPLATSVAISAPHVSGVPFTR
jgi:hypothetical protein